MVRKRVEIRCDVCGKIFYTEYYHGGSIEHDNETSDRNMHIHAKCVKDMSREKLNALFMDSILLRGNFCNIKDNRIAVAKEIFECRIKWFSQNGYDKIAEYLRSRESDVEVEYKKIKRLKVEELQREIHKIEGAN